MKGVLKTMISIIAIMFMFGLQWLFGAITIEEASPVFSWLFLIFSTLQGFFLFLFWVVISKEAREEWLNFFSCGKRFKQKKFIPTTSRAGTGTVSSVNKRNILASSSTQETSMISIKDSVASTHSVTDPNAYSVAEETTFALANGRTDGDVSQDDETAKEKMDDYQVPPHILERKHSDPAAVFHGVPNFNYLDDAVTFSDSSTIISNYFNSKQHRKESSSL